MIRCSEDSAACAEPMPGSAPAADVWIVVEVAQGWGDAPLARSGQGARVILARGEPTTGAEQPGGTGAAVRAWVAHCGPEPALRAGFLASAEEVADWDLGDVARGALRSWGHEDPEPLLLVCANGRRDPCCGHAGRRLAKRLWAGPHRGRVLTSTHLGGHRFAPTALLLPAGVLHGRLDERSATAVLEDAQRGLTPASTLRGFSVHTEAQQVADAQARALTGYRGLHPLDVDLQDAEHGPVTTARVSVPTGQSPLVLEMPLVLRERAVIASCGRPRAAMPRWTIGSPPDAARPSTGRGDAL